MGWRTASVALLLACPLAACGGADDAPEAAATPTSSHLDACTPAITGADPVAAEVLRPADGVDLPAAVWGEGGGTVLVLLHQTGTSGLCGWTPFAREVVTEGMSALAFDMCGWAQSACPDEWDERTSEQVATAVDHARTELGAERVVLVGASLGAGRTVYALADGVDPEAWIALSPPPAWDGRETAVEAEGITVPGLVVHDPEDGDAEFASSRRTARAAGATFRSAPGGHGYELLVTVDGGLSPTGRAVLAFAAG